MSAPLELLEALGAAPLAATVAEMTVASKESRRELFKDALARKKFEMRGGKGLSIEEIERLDAHTKQGLARTSAKQESYDTFVKSFPAPFDPLRPITNTPSSGPVARVVHRPRPTADVTDEAGETIVPTTLQSFLAALQSRPALALADNVGSDGEGEEEEKGEGDLPGSVPAEGEEEEALGAGLATGRMHVSKGAAPKARVQMNNFVDEDDEGSGCESLEEEEEEAAPPPDATVTHDDVMPF